VVLELVDAALDGDNVTFSATVLLDGDDASELVVGTTAYRSPPDSLGPVSLFVDPLEINELGICMKVSSDEESEASTEEEAQNGAFHPLVELEGIEPSSAERSPHLIRPFLYRGLDGYRTDRSAGPEGPPPGLSPMSAFFHAVSGLSLLSTTASVAGLR